MASGARTFLLSAAILAPLACDSREGAPAPRSEEAIRAEAAAALTDDRLARFAVYLREMIAGGQAMDPGQGLRPDPAGTSRTAEERALAKSGLTEADVAGLRSLVSHVFSLDPGAVEGSYERKYERKYGEGAAAILARHREEFLELFRRIRSLRAVRMEEALAEAAATLTDDRLARFASYQREMMPWISGTMEAMSAEGFSALDGRTGPLEAADEEARRKTGLRAGEVRGLTILTARYYSKRYLAIVLEKRAKEAAADPGRKRGIESTIAGAKAIQDEYEKKYGRGVVEILSRHEEEFLAIQGQLVEAVEKDPDIGN